MKTFFLPPGYRVELVASEPMVDHPILIDWDADGPHVGHRDCSDTWQDMPATNEREPDRSNQRARRHEQRRQDGQEDRVPRRPGPAARPEGARRRRARGRAATPVAGAATRTAISRPTRRSWSATATAARCADVEHNQNGLLWAMDNWMHTSEGTRTSGCKNGKIETRKTLSRGQWGGRRTTSVASIATRTARRSASTSFRRRTSPAIRTSLRTRAATSSWAMRTSSIARSRCDRTTASIAATQTASLRADGTLATYTGVYAPTVYRGDRLPAELNGNVFLAEPTGNLVSRVIAERRRRTAARRARPTRTPSSWPRPTSGSGLSICHQRPTARCTSSTCTTASSSTRATSPSTCAIRSSRTSSSRRSTWAGSAGSCTTRRGATRHRALSIRDVGAAGRDARRTRMAGGVTRRSSCSSSAATVGRSGAEDAGRDSAKDRADPPARAVDARRHSTDSTRPLVIKALDDPSRDVRRLGRPSGRALGWPSRIAGAQAAVLKRLDDPDWSSASSWRRRWARCPQVRERPRSRRCSNSTATDPVVIDAA